MKCFGEGRVRRFVASGSITSKMLMLSCQGIMMVMVLVRLFADDGVGENDDVIMFVILDMMKGADEHVDDTRRRCDGDMIKHKHDG